MRGTEPSSPMRETKSESASIATRLERIPAGRETWMLVVLLSLGAFFEIYDIFLTAYVSPGLVRSGIFPAAGGVFLGLSPQATFAACTFLGLFVGTMGLSGLADRFGRRSVFTWALLAYTAATILMACQSTARGIYLWRFLAGVGIGVELVTIDAYIAEFVPRRIRTGAFAFNAFVQFLAIPTAAFLAWQLVPRDPLGIAGWRWVTLVSALGAVVVWIIRLRVPESPRWLASRGRMAEAEAIVRGIEERVGGAVSTEPPDIVQQIDAGRVPADRLSVRGRILMLVVFQFFQTIGFYGFGNWLPALLAAKGASFVHSLQYSFLIALAYPLGPLLCMLWANRVEAKWQIVASALGIAVFGLAFSAQSSPAGIVAMGLLVTVCNCSMSFAYHAYQTELFPTEIRAKAVGFCYSWSRLSTVASSYMIAFFLGHFGTPGVFTLIAGSMGVVMAVIGFLGPKTRSLSLESAAHT